MSNGETKRLFFAFEVVASWPDLLPKGRLLLECQRHMTVAFLGQTNYSKLSPLLAETPLPPVKIGPAGKFDKIHFLPPEHPRVVGWNAALFQHGQDIAAYSRALIDWLKSLGFAPDDRKEFLPHVTLCRPPFDFHEWRQAFQKIPFYLSNLHLYESLGNLTYQPVWSHALLAPFEELDHTADIAFKVRGITTTEIYLHAMTALAFKCPELLKFHEEGVFETIAQVVMGLNRLISLADADTGCSMKAVSFHGEINQENDNILTWEMIVDV